MAEDSLRCPWLVSYLNSICGYKFSCEAEILTNNGSLTQVLIVCLRRPHGRLPSHSHVVSSTMSINIDIISSSEYPHSRFPELSQIILHSLLAKCCIHGIFANIGDIFWIGVGRYSIGMELMDWSTLYIPTIFLVYKSSIPSSTLTQQWNILII